MAGGARWRPWKSPVGRLDLTPEPDTGSYGFTGKGTVEPMLAGVIAQTMASPSTPAWNQIASFLEAMRQLKDSTGFAA
jgi:hypothetical protein